MEPGVKDSGRQKSIKQLIDEGLECGKEGNNAKALEKFDEAIRLDPDNVLALSCRAVARARGGEIALARRDLMRVVELNPDCADCWYELGRLNMMDGRLDVARNELGRCLFIDPAHADAYSTMAALEQQSGRYREALNDISQALLLRPDYPSDLHNRAVVLASLGRQAEAIKVYESVLNHVPSSAGTLNNLAWLLVTADTPSLRDCHRAIGLAQKAVAAYRSGAWLDTLAAAHAECGDFQKAIEIETEAYSLSRPPNPAFKRRLELYRRGTSYADWLDAH